MKYSFCVYSDNKVRVDMYLSALFKDFSRSYIQNIIDKWQIKVNWEIVTKNIKIKDRDQIDIEIIINSLSWVFPEKMDLDIIFENKDIIIINKGSWINVHPVPWEWGKSSTLVNWILHHCGENLPSINGVERPGIVHRLDKDTSGLIMVAKNDKMMSCLSKQIKEKKIWKYYLAIVSPLFNKKKFKIESYVGRDSKDKKKMTLDNPINPKLAITHWKFLKHIDNKYSLLMLKLETGRTHQIRIHLSWLGYPIIWDKKYWNTKINKQVENTYWLKRQALHAYFIDIDIYWKKDKFVAPLKKDMLEIIKDDIKTEF